MLEKGEVGEEGEEHGTITRLGIARGCDTGERESRSERTLVSIHVLEVDVCVSEKVMCVWLCVGLCQIVRAGTE